MTGGWQMITWAGVTATAPLMVPVRSAGLAYQDPSRTPVVELRLMPPRGASKTSVRSEVSPESVMPNLAKTTPLIEPLKAGSEVLRALTPFCTQTMPPAPLVLLAAAVPEVAPTPIQLVIVVRASRR